MSFLFGNDLLDIPDGTPHTLVWELPEELTARIAETD